MAEEIVFKAVRPEDREKFEEDLEQQQAEQDAKDGICRGSCGA